MTEQYQYIGDAALCAVETKRCLVEKPQDVRRWILETSQKLHDGRVVVTFVIDTKGRLWIADRRSEHVA